MVLGCSKGKQEETEMKVINYKITIFQSAALVNTRTETAESHEVLQNNCCVSTCGFRDMGVSLGYTV